MSENKTTYESLDGKIAPLVELLQIYIIDAPVRSEIPNQSQRHIISIYRSYRHI